MSLPDANTMRPEHKPDIKKVVSSPHGNKVTNTNTDSDDETFDEGQIVKLINHYEKLIAEEKAQQYQQEQLTLTNRMLTDREQKQTSDTDAFTKAETEILTLIDKSYSSS